MWTLFFIIISALISAYTGWLVGCMQMEKLFRDEMGDEIINKYFPPKQDTGIGEEDGDSVGHHY